MRNAILTIIHYCFIHSPRPALIAVELVMEETLVWWLPAKPFNARSFLPNSAAVLGISTLYFALVFAKILPSFRHLFLDSRGWSHRLFGGIHFALLSLGASFCWIEATSSNYEGGESNDSSNSILFSIYGVFLSNKVLITLIYDIVLGCSGVVTTLTAAKDFPHRLVRNKPGQSGSLDKEAIVTQAEMIEHSFYQGLNLLQALYLHGVYYLSSYTGAGSKLETSIAKFLRISPALAVKGPRILCLWLVTAPWLIRHRFPVHGFSQNWSKGSRTIAKEPAKSETTKKNIDTSNGSCRKEEENRNSNVSQKRGGEIVLYRIKKAQYLFYKHVILHGLNISVAVGGSTSDSLLLSSSSNQTTTTSNRNHRFDIPYGIHWRTFWLLLNTSYVMEFFLQTLVKRKVLSQAYMIVLQKILMLAASFSAMTVLFGNGTEQALVRPELCLLSLSLNFVHRHHDVFNTMGIALAFGLKNS